MMSKINQLSYYSQNDIIFLARILSLFLGFFIIILAVGVAAAEHGLIWPLNAIARASKVNPESLSSRKESLESLKKLDIQTGDEIEYLYTVITDSTSEIISYVDDIQKKSAQIEKLQNGLVAVLADMVESRDKCTGNHVRNTASYVRIIMEKMRDDGLYEDKLTDKYINEVVGAAPLHDVGKIHIPDSVLNKPGRLDDGEYAVMKTHTSVGGEIIDRVKDMVPDDNGYLTEAYNLTQYHHERWDGNGYPNGLKGEEIPLSARIMAVADVFDALVSKRSYKAGFPVDKAFEIIQNGSGSQFDPQVVSTFLECREEIEKIAEEANIRNEEEY